MEKREIVHIAKIGEKREKTFNFSPFCGIINYIRNKTNLIQMLDFTVFVHISKCIKIVQVKRRIPEAGKIEKNTKNYLQFAVEYDMINLGSDRKNREHMGRCGGIGRRT